MRLALVAMPWANFDMPSPALGALAAVARRDAPTWETDPLYEYVRVWAELGSGLYEAVAHDDRWGELLYAVHLFPERRDRVRRGFVSWCAESPERAVVASDPATAFDRLLEVTDRHADELAERLAGAYQLVGFTTSYCQLFASIVVAQRLKARDRRVAVVLGGMGVPYHIGPSVLRSFPAIDYVVQGEGEARLLALLQGLVDAPEGEPFARGDGLIARADLEDTPRERDEGDLAVLRDEIGNLDALPDPDYREYAEQARAHGIVWHLPIEASRGCWWDRVKRTGDPLKTCFFCSLNTSSYRHKSVARVADEMARQSERYENLRFRFLDNIIRHRGVESLGRAIRERGRPFRFFYEIRAQLHPRELLSLKLAGCETVQIGIEGLSSAYLERIGKGTSTIQNLQAMKTCYELGIYSGSNLLIGFPGATQAEVDETAETIRRFALAYQPTEIAPFALYVHNAVFRRPAHFGVSRVRTADAFRMALPEALWERLHLYWLDYDDDNVAADWSDVKRAVAEWRALHRHLTLEDGTAWFLGLKPLSYQDGGDFLEVIDRRHGLSVYTLRGLLREVYLECLEIRARSQLEQTFAGRLTPAELAEVLEALAEEDLIFGERGAYLALAVADRPEVAVARLSR